MQVDDFNGLRDVLDAGGDADPFVDESPVLALLMPMAENEQVRRLERPFSLRLNGNFSKQRIVCLVTSHRLCVGGWKGGMFGRKLVEQVQIPLRVCSGFETYNRPFGTGDLMYGLEARTSAGWVDMYFNTEVEQERIAEGINSGIAMRAWDR